jgi:hypothetical protein
MKIVEVGRKIDERNARKLTERFIKRSANYLHMLIFHLKIYIVSCVIIPNGQVSIL